ncbi:MAG: N-acetylmuramoyl-L-alanine amidase [Verrucomicrobiae bacterium]|nr:N-acetylmuramoyl-L-alanine amidase [Verrucomicrobiae bacterium]
MLGAGAVVSGVLGPVRTARAAKFTRVVIDPGHGGQDGGSKWYGVTEKNLTLDLAKRIQKALQEEGVTAVLTRSTDKYVELVDRAEVANKLGEAVFVSVHFNAHRDRSVKGIETFYYPGAAESRNLALAVQGELGRRIKTRNRGIKANALKVLQKTKREAILVECGFISNRWECQRCASTWFRQVLAEEIAQGILRYRDT